MANVANVVDLQFTTFLGVLVTIQDAMLMVREPTPQPQFVDGDPNALTETSAVF